MDSQMINAGLDTATYCNTLQHTATHCNTLLHTATRCITCEASQRSDSGLGTATHCNSLQHTATHCNSMRRPATQINDLQHTATHCSTMQHTATHGNTHASNSSGRAIIWEQRIGLFCREYRALLPRIQGSFAENTGLPMLPLYWSYIFDARLTWNIFCVLAANWGHFCREYRALLQRMSGSFVSLYCFFVARLTRRIFCAKYENIGGPPYILQNVYAQFMYAK